MINKVYQLFFNTRGSMNIIYIFHKLQSIIGHFHQLF